MPPVEDHPVHERTREKVGARWGCWNLPRRRDPYYVKDGHVPVGEFKTVQRWREIEDTGSKDCKHDASSTDQKCEGCIWIVEQVK